jgi:uncharacterized protein (UPF0147 family)
MDSLAQAVQLLRMLTEDTTFPKNARAKMSSTIIMLEKDGTTNVSKALGELESLSDDVNIPAHLRTQLFSVVSLLEVR